MDKLFLRGRQGLVHGKGYAKTSRRHEPECKWRPAAGRRRAERPNGPNQAAQAGFASRSISHWKANDEPPHLQGKASKNQAQLSRMGRPPYRRRKYTRNIALKRKRRTTAFAGRGVQAGTIKSHGRAVLAAENTYAISRRNANSEPSHSHGEASKQAQSNRMGRPSTPSQGMHAKSR